MELSDPQPSILAIVSILGVGLILLGLAAFLRRRPGGRLALALAVAWYAAFGAAFLYPHNHHRIWSAALSYRGNYAIDAALGVAWIVGSWGLWRRRARWTPSKPEA